MKALNLCRKILDGKPDHADALGLGGIVAFQAGDVEQSVEYLRKAVKLNPKDAQTHNDLGVVLQAAEKAEEAVDSFRRAVEINPNDATAQNNLGVQLHRLSKLDEAVDALERAIQADPGYWIAHNSLGNALLDQGRVADAEASFRRAINFNPGYAVAFNNLGAALHKLEKFDEAADAYRGAVKIDPGLAKAYDGLGKTYMNLESPEESEAAHRQSLKLEPDRANAHHNLGIALQSLGKLKDAEASFRRAIELNPDCGNSYRHLTMSKKFVEKDADLKAMEDLLPRLEDDGEDAMFLCFALGKAYNDLGDYDRAFAHFEKANQIKQASLDYDVSKEEEEARRIAQQFNAEFLGGRGSGGFASEVPIFVLGMPRSGTTLVEQILAAHSQVHGAGELEDFYKLADEANPDDLERFGRTYVEGLTRRAPEASKITDKMPVNFLYIGLIHMALPEAKIIHCVRDPVDTCLSCYMQFFAESQDFTYDLTDLGRYYLMYAKLMNHWRAVLPEKILDVHYEDVVADQEAQTKRLLDFCDLQWEDACLDFHKAKRSVRTASLAQVRRPVYTGSVKRWERYKDHLGPLLKALKL